MQTSLKFQFKSRFYKIQKTLPDVSCIRAEFQPNSQTHNKDQTPAHLQRVRAGHHPGERHLGQTANVLPRPKHQLGPPTDPFPDPNTFPDPESNSPLLMMESITRTSSRDVASDFNSAEASDPEPTFKASDLDLDLDPKLNPDTASSSCRSRFPLPDWGEMEEVGWVVWF